MLNKRENIIGSTQNPLLRRGLGRLLVLDNYDSFTYNLVHIAERILQQKIDVFRNDKIALEEIDKYDKIILSPGPGIPSEAGILLDLIKTYAPTKSILGVCLGEQAIGEAFGAKLINLKNVYHGVATKIKVSSPKFQVSSSSLFANLPNEIEVGRYHSWVVDRNNFPEELEITAEDENGYIMALRHKTYDVQGVQFHPESVLTPDGEKIMRNWLNAHPLKGSKDL